MDKLRILVADDSQFMRIAYRKILETQDNFEIVGMAENGEEALEKGLDLAPDVAILDVRMPKMDGIEAAHRITTQHPGTAVIIISAFDDLTFVAELIKDGPQRKAYLLKNSLDDIGELIRVVEAVSKGQTVLDPIIVQKIARRLVRESKPLLSRLTEVECNVLELMAEGYDDSSIGRILHLDKDKVKDDQSSIYQKLGISKQQGRDQRVQAVLAFVNQCTSVSYDVEVETHA